MKREPDIPLNTQKFEVGEYAEALRETNNIRLHPKLKTEECETKNLQLSGQWPMPLRNTRSISAYAVQVCGKNNNTNVAHRM